MKLSLIRHAESEGNAGGVIQGQAEYPLSERGWTQARLLAARVAQEHPTTARVWRSNSDDDFISPCAKASLAMAVWLSATP